MKAIKKEIKQLLQANKMIEKFCQRLEKTEISAFNLYRECGNQMQYNSDRIERLKTEAYEMAESEEQYQFEMKQFS